MNTIQKYFVATWQGNPTDCKQAAM